MRRQSVAALALAGAAVLTGFVAPIASAQPLAIGPEIVLPAGPGCPVTDPQIAALAAPFGEVWVWSQGQEIHGARFAEGAVEPSERGAVVAGRLPDVGRNSRDAWLAFHSGSNGELLKLAEGNQSLPPGPEPPVLGNTVGIATAVAADGRVLVAHQVPRLFIGTGRVEVTVYNSDGLPLGDSRPIGGEVRGVSTVALPDNSFVVTWLEIGGDGDIRLVARRVALNGAGIGEVSDPVVLAQASSTGPAFEQIPLTPPTAAARPGGVVFAWGDNPIDGSGSVAWRLYDLRLRPIGPTRFFDGGDFPVDRLSLESSPVVAAAADGQLGFVWESGDRLGGLVLEAGQGTGTAFAVDSGAPGRVRKPDADFDPTGELTVVWELGPVQPPPFDAQCGRATGTSIRGRRFSTGMSCPDGALCLLDDRFAVTVAWDDPFNGGSGLGTPVPVTDDTGTFWFFNAGNLELMVKVLDGRAVNDHFWVFFGSLTNVEFDLTVRDRLTGAVKTYNNPPFTFASRGDTTAF